MQYRFKRGFLGGTVVLVAAILVAAGNANARDCVRSCRATIGVGASTPLGQWLEGVTFASFTGSGVVGYYAPNSARLRARRNIDACISAAWQSSFSPSRHPYCTESNRIYNFACNSFHFAIQQAVCGANPGHERISVNVNVGYSGGRGCLLRTNSWNRLVTSGYTIECPAREFEAGADRPGFGSVAFSLNSADPELCRDACLGDQPGFRAWTYFHPGCQGAAARCRLKNGVPAPQPSDCAVSGVISDL